MEKKNYQKPDMHVVMMKHQSYLLETTGANPGGGSHARSHRMDDDE